MSEPSEPEKDVFGRPRLDTPQMIQKAIEYIDEFDLFFEQESGGKVNKMVQGIPSIAGLSRRLGVSRQTIYNWEIERNSDFLDILDDLRAKQEEFLLYHGLTKGYDSGFAKFITTNLTKFKDKQETEVNQKIQINIDGDDGAV